MYSILRTEENGVISYLTTTKSINNFRQELKPVFVATDIKTFEEATYIIVGFRRAEEVRVKNLKNKIMKKYIHINASYGIINDRLKREYKSKDEFNHDIETLSDDDWSSPILVEIELAEDEEYYIHDYDGAESIMFRKKGVIKSKIITHNAHIDIKNT
jgi:hypothetical protein